MESPEEFQAFINTLDLLPKRTIKNINQEAIREYIRKEAYNELKTEFERDSPFINFDLFLWINNWVANDPKEPVLWLVPPAVNYADHLIYNTEDKSKIIEEKEHIAERTRLVRSTWEEIKKENFPLEISKGTQQITLRRKYFGTPSIPFDISDYEKLANQLANIETDEEKSPYIEMYMLRPRLIMTPLPADYYKALTILGVDTQLFSTALDHQFDNYGSEFYDIDHYFGSFGSVLKDKSAADILLAGGSFEANLVQYGELHSIVIGKLDYLIATSKKPITLYIVHDLTIDKNQHQDLSTFARNMVYDGSSRNWLILKNKKAPAISDEQLSTAFEVLNRASINADQEAEEGALVGRYTLPILTPFEKAAVLGRRALQLADDAPPKIKVPEGVVDVLLVAEMELEAGVCPMKVKRPDGDWDVNELEDFDSGNYLYNQGPSSL